MAIGYVIFHQYVTCSNLFTTLYLIKLFSEEIYNCLFFYPSYFVYLMSISEAEEFIYKYTGTCFSPQYVCT